jgi:hypothetical protein
MNDADRQLLDHWLDGEADAAEVRALLERDEDAVRWLAARAELHADLQQSLARRRLQRAAEQAAGVSRGRVIFARFAWAAAAAVVLSLCVWFFRSRETGGVLAGGEGIPVEIVAAENAGADWQGGGSRAVREISLATGHLTVRLERGVLLDIFAPARLALESASVVRLASGKVTADVGAAGKGFTIITPQTRVVDLGTVFGVEAGAEGRTDVVVFSGEVELHDDAPVEKLFKGEAVRVSKTDGRKRIANVVTSRRRAEWSTAAPPEGCAFRSVTDDAERGTERFAYHIAPGGLVDGAEAFVDLPYVLRGVPAALQGADLVRTFRGARKSPRFEMQVSLARPAAVLLLFDAASAPPGWLARDFQKTADTVTLASPDPAARRTVTLNVWRREVRAADTLTLGSVRDDQGAQPMMYVLAARPLE